ncbi:HAMP domain-containing sensor histidine kinase [Phytohabitans sp. ZYX-F-186]|uniref:histidine kinase n=1 Tax=Phytohabitans maris TaxID=3071409 RepID=A0ABU0ZBW6_9ACTN|nr:HAMP domain-containing sensor histidine kinase [Phytohabitans sp. ZYX-F-186]MDQ7904559.1 HAMP domain-containing sensor histidine kinase [Phytohabitans sp. ZYX-F-186]
MRRRLALLVTATACLVLVAFLVPLAVLIREVAEDRAVVAATGDLQGLVPLAATSDAADLAALASGASRPVTVYLPDGSSVGAEAPRTPAVELAARGRSLTAESGGGREIVVGVQGRPEGTVVLRTFVPAEELTRGVTRAWLVLAALGVALVLVGLVVADRLARTFVAAIAELSTVSHRLAGAELDARATPAGPAELRDVAGALNHLAGRIQDLLREEREQVADLSHRLRTPLTALRLEAEALGDPAEAARVTAGVDAVERAVSGLIRAARRTTPAPLAAGCDAAAVVRDRVAFWAVLAEDTGREVSLDLVPGPLPVPVAAEDLAAAVDALLGNVFAHTPDGTPFAVSLTAGGVLTVADEGPGLPAGAGERGESGAGSTGLGLDIARRAGQALHLSTSPTGGALVTLDLLPGP